RCRPSRTSFPTRGCPGHSSTTGRFRALMTTTEPGNSPSRHRVVHALLLAHSILPGVQRTMSGVSVQRGFAFKRLVPLVRLCRRALYRLLVKYGIHDEKSSRKSEHAETEPAAE